jgi:hypothetical protein
MMIRKALRQMYVQIKKWFSIWGIDGGKYIYNFSIHFQNLLCFSKIYSINQFKMISDQVCY